IKAERHFSITLHFKLNYSRVGMPVITVNYYLPGGPSSSSIRTIYDHRHHLFLGGCHREINMYAIAIVDDCVLHNSIFAVIMKSNFHVFKHVKYIFRFLLTGAERQQYREKRD